MSTKNIYSNKINLGLLNFLVFITPGRAVPTNNLSSPFNHISTQLVLFFVVLMLIIILSIIIFKLCSHNYRREVNPYYGRAASVSSIEQLTRNRLRDRPPSYMESQNSLNVETDIDPPSYYEIMYNKFDNPNVAVYEAPPYSEYEPPNDICETPLNPMIFYMNTNIIRRNSDNCENREVCNDALHM